jgi:hypothetical protein
MILSGMYPTGTFQVVSDPDPDLMVRYPLNQADKITGKFKVYPTLWDCCKIFQHFRYFLRKYLSINHFEEKFSKIPDFFVKKFRSGLDLAKLSRIRLNMDP